MRSGIIVCPKKSKLLAVSYHPQQDRIQRQLPSALLHQLRPRERPFLYTTHNDPAHSFAAHKATSHASEGRIILRFIVQEASSSVHYKKACVESGAFPLQDLSCWGARPSRRTLRRLLFSFRGRAGYHRSSVVLLSSTTRPHPTPTSARQKIFNGENGSE